MTWLLFCSSRLASVAGWKAGYVCDEKYEEFGEWLLENPRLLNSWAGFLSQMNEEQLPTEAKNITDSRDTKT